MSSFDSSTSVKVYEYPSLSKRLVWLESTNAHQCHWEAIRLLSKATSRHANAEKLLNQISDRVTRLKDVGSCNNDKRAKAWMKTVKGLFSIRCRSRVNDVDQMNRRSTLIDLYNHAFEEARLTYAAVQRARDYTVSTEARMRELDAARATEDTYFQIAFEHLPAGTTLSQKNAMHRKDSSMLWTQDHILSASDLSDLHAQDACDHRTSRLKPYTADKVRWDRQGIALLNTVLMEKQRREQTQKHADCLHLASEMFQSTQSKANMAIIRLNQAVEKMAAHLKQPGLGTAMLSILTSFAVDPGSATSNSAAASQYALSTHKPSNRHGRALRSLFSSPGQALQDTDEEILEPLLFSRHSRSSSSPQFQPRMSVCSARSSMACTTHHSKRGKAKRTISSPSEVSSISELPDMPADPAADVTTSESCRHFSCYCSPVYCPMPTGANIQYPLLLPQNQESARGSEGSKTSIRSESPGFKVNKVRIIKERQSSNLEASSPVHESFIQQQQYQLQHLLHQHLPGMTVSALILETHSSTVGNFVSKSLLDEDFSVRFRNQSLSISPPLVTSLLDLSRQEGGDIRLTYTHSSAPLSVGGMNLLSLDTLSLAKSAVRSAQGALDSWQGGMALLKIAASHNTYPHFEDYTKGQSDVSCSFSKLCLKMTSIDWSEGVRVEQLTPCMELCVKLVASVEATRQELEDQVLEVLCKLKSSDAAIISGQNRFRLHQRQLLLSAIRHSISTSLTPVVH